jgi:hypothetical protein
MRSLSLLSTSQAKLARLAYIVNTAVDLSLSSSNNITSHLSQAQGELPLLAKPSPRIPIIYTAPVIVPVVIVEQLVAHRGNHELVESLYISSGCWNSRLVCGSNH